jgi:hypothetical protein
MVDGDPDSGTPQSAPSPLFEGPFDKAPVRKPGTLIVAVGSRGTIALGAGERLTWGERVFGGYRNFYLVDVSPKSIPGVYVLGTNEATMSFVANVTYDVRIRDAKAIIERGVTDLSTLLSTPVKRALLQVSKRHVVKELPAARQAMQEVLETLPLDPSIERIDVSVDLKADDAAQKLLREVDEQGLKTAAIQAQGEIDKVARGNIRDLLKSTDDLLAHMMATKDESFRTALQMKMEQAASDQERWTLILKALIDSKIIEPHDFHERFPDFMNEMFRALPSRDVAPQSKVILGEVAPRASDNKADGST